MADALAPWLQSAWQTLLQRHQAGRMPHALLLHGVAGIGKSRLAQHIARTLLCENPAGALNAQQPCTSCSPCQLLQAGTHPDLNIVGLLENDAFIKVDAVRGLIHWLQLTPQYGGYKITIIESAAAMNRSAANSLLKTLEEPASRVLILLLTEAPGSLPATVRSRCQSVRLAPARPAEAVAWLQAHQVGDAETALSLASGGPYRALAMADSGFPEQRQRLLVAWRDIILGKTSIARAVDSIADLPTALCLQRFASWAADAIKLQVDAAAAIGHEPDRSTLTRLHRALKIEDWFSIYAQMSNLYRIDSTSFKSQTVLEGVFAAIRLKQPAD